MKTTTIKTTTLKTIALFAAPLMFACGGVDGELGADSLGEDVAHEEDDITFRPLDPCKGGAADETLYMGPGVVSLDSTGLGANKSGFCKRWVVDVSVPSSSGAPGHYDFVNMGADAPILAQLPQGACQYMKLYVNRYTRNLPFQSSFSSAGSAVFQGEWFEPGFGSPRCIWKQIGGAGYVDGVNPGAFTRLVRFAATAKYGSWPQQVRVNAHHQAMIY